ncbi:DUF262 domain-containing protein [Helicobacter bizzozeronii]|uniref:DUF262 domain-containing protein n=1 Tax=Helicobacter bizzozeronii TaxID=56877 RepID=UPI000CF0B52B|nr:DUF262 domain-containing protein [Helicobacter bizzozeronii]
MQEEFFCNYSEKDCQELIRCLLEGEYQIPRFQRDFVWKKDQVAKFIDSLAKGFPTGSFLVWKTKERLQSSKEIGQIFLKEPKTGEIYYVLDGQQRMSALFVVYQGLKVKRSSRVFDDYKDIMLRLESDEDKDFCFVRDPKVETNEVAVSVYDLINLSIVGVQQKYKLNAEATECFEELKKKIVKYRLPVIEVANAPLSQAIEMFARINKGGTKFSYFPMACAKFYIAPTADESQTIITDPGFDLQERFDLLCADLNRLNYGFDQPMAVLQLISYLVHQNSPTPKKRIVRDTILKLDAKKVWEMWGSLTSAYAHAAHLLKHDFKIPSFSFLPSVGSFVLMACFYALSGGKSPNATQVKRLKQLLFRGMFFGNSKNADLLKQLDLVADIYAQKPLDLAKELPLNLSLDFLVAEKFSTRNTLHQATLCVLASLEPCDFNNNSKVVLDNFFASEDTEHTKKRHLHHFYPKNHLKHIAPKQNPDVIANITFLSAKLNQEIKDSPPKIYIEKYRQSNPHLDQTLQTHLIDLASPKVLEDYQAFLRMRAQKILEKIKELT